ncbi:PA0069 family radical SAM protein [Curvibacter sp. HBC28]|uniref:PA0069 family radical SAM protein n=1 Tax=Curvibacter microcysteis TaxID=3026419 RepID=A0ABT5MPL0_9BURK|nr:PA0069 family radical SAM protein [Curvibacter sp. HBC28]MDD0817171.1 PA0069 family radical SAM protein [Curvibacter sp. HBC28]
MDDFSQPVVFQRPPTALKGRGAASGMAHRFERDQREAVDDGWPVSEDEAFAAQTFPTRVIRETARSALSRNDSPDIAFDQAINPYRGCEHGCSYCYARPTHSYLGLSPGLDFETQIVAKHNLPELLDQALSRPGYVPRLTNVGSATDCYQPVERELGLTRRLIEVFQRHRHPFSIITKSSLIERDLDLLAPLAQQGLVAVYITITTLDATLARRLEPRAASPLRRLRTVKTLAEAGIPVGVSVAPQIPFLNEDMERVLSAAAEAGAGSAFYTVLRLPWELNELFQQWLQQHYPERADRIMARVRDFRGGQDYQSDFKTRMKGHGLWADLLNQRFHKACARLGLNRERHELDVSQFLRDPDQAFRQPSLFDDPIQVDAGPSSRRAPAHPVRTD